MVLNANREAMKSGIGCRAARSTLEIRKIQALKPMIESVLLATSKILTFAADTQLTNASGFFFERDKRLFLITSRHVLRDDKKQHFPDRIEIALHVDAENLADCVGFSIPLYDEGKSAWRQGEDAGGAIDVAAIEIDRGQLPKESVLRAFTPEHLVTSAPGKRNVEIGAPLLILGFPLGFQDTLHQIPVARHAIVASSFGFRFQGRGYFLTDARTHRGSSGAPVVMRSRTDDAGLRNLPWLLLGVHSARLDLASRDANEDEVLGLNCAWYADILMTLTDKRSGKAPEA